MSSIYSGELKAVEWPMAGGCWWVVPYSPERGNTPVKQFTPGRQGRCDAEAHVEFLNAKILEGAADKTDEEVEVVKVPCHFCSRSVEAEDAFCSGCRVHVCEECDINWNMPFGTHAPEAHREEPDCDE